MHRVCLHAHDTLFFRDNRPGSAGEPMTARFPMPSVLFGALRSHYLRSGGINMSEYGRRLHPQVEEVIGEPDPEPLTGALRLLGPFLIHGEELLLPAPAALLTTNAGGKVRAAVPAPADGAVLWDLSEQHLRPLQLPAGERANPTTAWLSLTAWQRLVPALSPVPAVSVTDLVPAESLYTIEPRMGHRRDPQTLRPEDRQLFRADHLRFNNVETTGFAVLAEGIDERQLHRWQGPVLLGGERRQATATVSPWQSPFDQRLCDRAAANLGDQGRAFVCLVSPASFRAGWLPRLPELADARLVGAVVPPPEPVAGWDLKRRQHKPLRHLVPAGATYFYEGVDETSFRSLWKRCQLHQSIADHGARAGFGAAVIGAWRSR